MRTENYQSPDREKKIQRVVQKTRVSLILRFVRHFNKCIKFRLEKDLFCPKKREEELFYAEVKNK
jgi:hypothetical protein